VAIATGRCAGEPSAVTEGAVGDGALDVPAPLIKRLFTSSFGLELGVGEGDAEVAGVSGLERGLFTEDLGVTPLVAGMEPNDLTLAASEERGGADAGLEERGACGSAIDPNDNPAAIEASLRQDAKKKF
jgi:hypothetical protein